LNIVHPAFNRTDHRPWDLPKRAWSWRQTWRDLLFAHWPIPSRALRPLVPPPLEVQEFDGTSWVGLVPFRMDGVMWRPLPDLPWVSAFPEMNLRLYVEHGGKPGVWFVSLDAANPLAVWAARRFFHLPYFRATMSLREEAGKIHYRSTRATAARPVVLGATYWPTSDVYEARRGTLEHFLTERYCLYARAPDGAILRTEVHHLPWPLQRAAAELHENTVAAHQDVNVGGPAAFLHFSRRLDVVVYPPERAA
jgi:uncharacterized protein